MKPGDFARNGPSAMSAVRSLTGGKTGHGTDCPFRSRMTPTRTSPTNFVMGDPLLAETDEQEGEPLLLNHGQ